MRIVDALREVLKDNYSLTYKEAYEEIVKRKLYEFSAKQPESAVNAKLRCHCEGLDFPGASPVKYFKIVGQKGARNLYALIDATLHTLPKNTQKSEHSKDDLLPEEKMDESYQLYRDSLKTQLLNRILSCHPSFFEQLVLNLLLEMGYGFDNQSGQVTSKSHDGGIDGVIYEDSLGLSRIYIQAKRYGIKNNVSEELIKHFYASMQGVNKGVFITTSAFTSSAKKFVNDQKDKNIIMIDGEHLVDLMIKYGIGLEKVKTYIVYKLNEDYFE